MHSQENVIIDGLLRAVTATQGSERSSIQKVVRLIGKYREDYNVIRSVKVKITLIEVNYKI